MVDTPAASETVFRLIYRSHMRIASDVRKSELGEIFSIARSNNKRLGVTGALLVWDEFFVQTLEGDETVVRDLYDRIHRDARHERVAIISEDPAAERVFGRWSMALTLLFVIPLFVSENVRLYGWVLFLIKNGVLLGSTKTLFGYEPASILFTLPAIVLGMVYVYLPYMLFPMSLGVAMVPNEVREAASDLGATRWQVFREVELPLSMPGIVIGFLLTFVLAVGAIAESVTVTGDAILESMRR